MKKLSVIFASLLMLVAPALAQEVLLPPEVKGRAGFPIVIAPIKVDGGEPRWKVGTGLTQFDLTAVFDFGKDVRQKAVVVVGDNGTYEVWAWNAKGDKASAISVTKVVIGSPDIKPIPPPPIPPDIKPIPPPTPSVAPIAAEGVHVLIIEESEERVKLPLPQYSMLFDAEFRAWLSAKTTPMPDGSQGWRIYDKDDEVKKVWDDALRRPRVYTQTEKDGTTTKIENHLPWIIVSNSRKGGYEGPLPANKTEAMAIISKYLD